jgi:hypothetical protein
MNVYAASPGKQFCTSRRVRTLKIRAVSADEEILLAKVLRVLSNGGDLNVVQLDGSAFTWRTPGSNDNEQ